MNVWLKTSWPLIECNKTSSREWNWDQVKEMCYLWRADPMLCQLQWTFMNIHWITSGNAEYLSAILKVTTHHWHKGTWAVEYAVLWSWKGFSFHWFPFHANFPSSNWDENPWVDIGGSVEPPPNLLKQIRIWESHFRGLKILREDAPGPSSQAPSLNPTSAQNSRSVLCLFKLHSDDKKAKPHTRKEISK